MTVVGQRRVLARSSSFQVNSVLHATAMGRGQDEPCVIRTILVNRAQATVIVLRLRFAAAFAADSQSLTGRPHFRWFRIGRDNFGKGK